MAELAVICHWSPREMDDMDVDELLDWHGRVIAVHNHLNGGE